MAHTHSVIDDDLRFIIDPSTREIGNGSQKVKLMQYDHNSEQFTFEIPRFVEGHDMSLCNSIRINYININKSTREPHPGVYEVSDIQVEEDNIIFSWLVSRNATQYVGPLNFLIKFMCFDENDYITYEWHTDIFKSASVSTGMNNEESIEEVYPDILEKWKNDVLAAETSRVTAESERAAAESERAAAESERAAAESERAAAESERVTAESERVAAESERVTAESERVTAESERVAAESERVTAESERVTAESERVAAESERVAAESERVSAESERVSAESERVSAESERANTFARYETEINQFKNEIVTGKDSATDNTKFAIGTAEQTLEVPSMEEFNQVKENKVDKDEIFNAGIRSISYAPLFGGSFTVTTVEEEGYIKPHAIATITGRISKHYTYRVTINEEEYVLPCYLFSTRDRSGKVVEYLGNIELYTSDISGLMQDAMHNVPFCIISDLNNKNSIDVFTRSPCEVSIIVERIQKEQTPLPKSLIWGDDYCPIELKKNENSTFNGISIGCNILKNSRGTFAIGYGNKISREFGIAIGYGNTLSGASSYAEGYNNTSSGIYSHAEGFNTTASGDMSRAEGFSTTASGSVSHAKGFGTTASGFVSHAEGQSTKANGAMSHSGGNGSITGGRASFAHGNFSKTTQPAQFAVGYGNDPQEDSIFEVGNGLNADGAPNNAGNTEPVTRQNAFRVTQSGVAIAQTGLQIGNTVVSEDQLKKILALIE